jgi:methylase of polypeptide subunit release factors
VIATDINPNAALSVRDNASRNGAGPQVTAVAWICCQVSLRFLHLT